MKLVNNVCFLNLLNENLESSMSSVILSMKFSNRSSSLIMSKFYVFHFLKRFFPGSAIQFINTVLKSKSFQVTCGGVQSLSMPYGRLKNSASYKFITTSSPLKMKLFIPLKCFLLPVKIRQLFHISL